MPRHIWRRDARLFVMHWFQRQEVAPKPSSGLVLSGGGARVSFHIGAMRYLYERAHIAPDTIAATSGGSIVAAIISQSLDPASQLAHLTELEQVWLAMTGPDELFVEQAWFTRLRAQWGDIAGLLSTKRNDKDDEPTQSDDDPMQRVQKAMQDDPSSAVTASFSTLWPLISSLPRLGRAGAGLAASLRGAELAESAYRPGPIVDRLLFKSTFQSQRVAESGVQLRICFVDLNSGDLRYMRQDGVIVDNDDHPIDGSAHDLTLGVWASCTMPGVFRPVKIGTEVYVDGGVRQYVPVETAITNLGATRPYVIAASPLGVHREDFSDKDIPAVMLRISGITIDEAYRNEMLLAKQAGACIIMPRLSVHDAMSVEPALLRINRDYGWMCAAEAVTNATSSLRDIDDAIIDARCQWAALAKQDADTDADALQQRISQLLAQADTALLPPGYQEWADEL